MKINTSQKQVETNDMKRLIANLIVWGFLIALFLGVFYALYIVPFKEAEYLEEWNEYIIFGILLTLFYALLFGLFTIVHKTLKWAIDRM